LSGPDLGAGFSSAPGGTAHWVFTDAAGDVAIAIAKADALVSVSGYSGTYDGQAHGATGSAVGVNGESLLAPDLGQSFTNAPCGTAHWVFTAATGNDNDGSGTGTDQIPARTPPSHAA